MTYRILVETFEGTNVWFARLTRAGFVLATEIGDYLINVDTIDELVEKLNNDEREAMVL